MEAVGPNLDELPSNLPEMIRQASDTVDRSHLECFCTDRIESKPGNLRLKCNCLVHYDCLVSYIRSKTAEEMRKAKGVGCPYLKAGVCGYPDRALITTESMQTMLDDFHSIAEGLTEATSDILNKEEVEKFERWISEPSFLDLKPTGGDTVSMGRNDSKQDGSDTDAYIAATTKPCPVCGYRATHFHGHSCHHTLDGCPQCNIQYCYKCLATETENMQIRGMRPQCLCGGWSNFCKAKDIMDNLVLVPYPHDKVHYCPLILA